MKTKRIILYICTVAVTTLLIIHSFGNVDLKDTKRQHFKAKIYPRYYDEDLHVEWPFVIGKHYNDSDICNWNEPKQPDHINSDGNGENGTAWNPSDDEKELMDKLIQENNYNLLASDMMSLHRTLPDPRSEECKHLLYPEKLPTASVIIIFHNEAWTALLRTVWSVVDRSPPELIKEIILVDDLSTWTFLKRPLADYIETIPVKIKIIRTLKREGLIRARLLGAQHSVGSVLIFLDAHMECNKGWLPPLLAHIASDRSSIAVPLIDIISSQNMMYEYNTEAFVNGFGWALGFTWMSVPERELIRTNHDKTAALRTPTMVGCAFSIDREFFFEIGSYDEGMNIWGSENIEMSLRVWQCGGSMQVIPCSRVGHLYRISTYSFNDEATKIIAENTMRVVEVWMTDLKHLYYATFVSDNKNYSVGDLTQRKNLKQRLNCKDFRWFLQNVYPESNMKMDFIFLGEIRRASENVCLDIYFGDVGNALTMFSCHGIGGNQFFAFAKNQVIATQNPEACVGANEGTVVLVKCMEDETQKWKYIKKNNWLIHISSGLCVQANDTAVILGKCDPGDIRAQWKINLTL